MQPSVPAKRKRKAIVIGVSIAALGVAGYFGWQYVKKKKEEGKESPYPFDSYSSLGPSTILPSVYTPAPVAKPSSSTPKTTDNFPLKKGSKGPNVKALQNALIAQYGASILPKYGADGDFGDETAAALKKVGLPISVDASTLNVLAKGSAPDAAELAQNLYSAISTRNFTQVLSLLGKISTPEEYSAVSTQFQNFRIGLVRQTLVNGALSAFSDENQKQQIRLAFMRMGLKYDGDKWALSGINGYTLITNQATRVWVDPNIFVQVPAKVVLGQEVSRKADHAVFENQGRYFIVPTAHVQYL